MEHAIGTIDRGHGPVLRPLVARASALVIGGALLAGCGSAPASPATHGGQPSSSPTSSTPAPAVSAGTALFPVAVGETWDYRSSGLLEHGTTTNKIIAVAPASNAKKVTILSYSALAGLPPTTTHLTYLFFPDGSIGVPYLQIGKGTVTIKSGSIVWPSEAVLDSRQPRKSVLVIAIRAGGRTIDVTAHVTVRGGGTQTVTVPAGTYHATVVDEALSEEIGGASVTVTLRSWLAPGVGPVKSEGITGSKVVLTEVLTSYKAS